MVRKIVISVQTDDDELYDHVVERIELAAWEIAEEVQHVEADPLLTIHEAERNLTTEVLVAGMVCDSCHKVTGELEQRPDLPGVPVTPKNGFVLRSAWICDACSIDRGPGEAEMSWPLFQLVFKREAELLLREHCGFSFGPGDFTYKIIAPEKAFKYTIVARHIRNAMDPWLWQPDAERWVS